MLLFVTTVFAEYLYLVIPAQLITLGWALNKQRLEHPYAEVGSKKRATLMSALLTRGREVIGLRRRRSDHRLPSTSCSRWAHCSGGGWTTPWH